MSASPSEPVLSKDSILLQNLERNVSWTDLTRFSQSPAKRFSNTFCGVSMPTFVGFVISRSKWQQEKDKVYIFASYQKCLQRSNYSEIKLISTYK